MAKELGTWGEQQARQFLQRKGYRILRQNYRVWEGEIDIIAEKDDVVTFVEVKTRSSTLYGSPEESLNGRKQERLLRAGYRFLEESGRFEDLFQFDLIAIECSPGGKIKRLSHYEDVIGGDGLA